MDEALMNFLLGAGTVLFFFLLLFAIAYLNRPRLKVERVDKVELWMGDKVVFIEKCDLKDQVRIGFTKDAEVFCTVYLSHGEFKKFREAILSFGDSPQKEGEG